MKAEQLVSGIWYGDGATAFAARALLAPAALLFGAAVRARNALYDAGVLRSQQSPLPTVSVGNLTVGGTGKTPVAAYIVARLLACGARPALLMRGYGDDEEEVHRRLNPGVPVVVSPDRTAAAREAARAHGANVLVLDDGFQHRRLRRAVDAVVVSADGFARARRMLPAGPLREPLSALGRATHLLITRKAADDATVALLRATLLARAPLTPQITLALRPRSLVAPGGEDRPISALRGKRVLMIAAIGDPAAFEMQLSSAGAKVTSAIFADHHSYRPQEVESLARSAATHDFALCTLKDVVKLQPLWPRATTPLWYVSQSVEVEHGGDNFDQMLNALIKTKP